MLVGLLWTRTIREDGKEKFTFECRVDENKNPKVDTFFFWGSIYTGLKNFHLSNNWNIYLYHFKFIFIIISGLALIYYKLKISISSEQ